MAAGAGLGKAPVFIRDPPAIAILPAGHHPGVAEQARQPEMAIMEQTDLP